MRPSDRRALELLLHRQIDELIEQPWNVAQPFRDALDRLKTIPAEGDR